MNRYFKENEWSIEQIKQDFPQEKLETIVEMIDEPIIRTCFKRKMSEIFENKVEQIKKQIAAHKAQIEMLKNELNQQN